MKHSIIRLCSAFLLLGIGLVLTLGVIATVCETQPTAAWTRVEFATQGKQSICLYDAQGKLLEHIETDERGEGSSTLLPAGEYFAACMEGFLSFRLEETGSLQVTRGGSLAGERRLCFSSAPLGTLRIEREAKQEWYDYLLQNEDYRRREVVRCETGDLVECVLSGIPYGSYTLEENGTVLCTVELSPQNPQVALSLP